MKRCLRLFAVQFALAAMLLRALVPAGWMPNADAAAGTPITICTMNGPVQIDSGTDGQPLKKNQDRNDLRHHEACPFAAAPAMAQPTPATALMLPSPISQSVQLSAYRDLAVQAVGYTPQSPRAPPRVV